MRLTPPVDARGIFELRTPWSVPADEIYTCIAVRNFDDIYKEGIDVFKEYYEPKSIDITIFTADAVAKATIVTLESATGAHLYVPDTYINSYPDMSGIRYDRIILSVDCGPLPANLDLTNIKTAIEETVIESIGVASPTVKEHIAPTASVISQANHDTLETARQAAIDAVNTAPYTDMGKLDACNALNSQLILKIEALTQLLADNGIVV